MQPTDQPKTPTQPVASVERTAEQFATTFADTLPEELAIYFIKTSGPLTYQFAEAFAVPLEAQVAELTKERDDLDSQVQTLAFNLDNALNEIRGIDEVLARRPALADVPRRTAAIERACFVAGKADKAERELESSQQAIRERDATIETLTAQRDRLQETVDMGEGQLQMQDATILSLQQEVIDRTDSKRTFCHLCHSYFTGDPDGHGFGECVSLCEVCHENQADIDTRDVGKSIPCAPCRKVLERDATIQRLQGEVQEAIKKGYMAALASNSIPLPDTQPSEGFDEATEKRWQDAIYEACKYAVGPANFSLIDGGGCDSGDALDFSLTEIRQAIGYWREKSEGVTAGPGRQQLVMPLRFYKPPFEFREPKTDSEGPCVFDAEGHQVAMLMWSTHPSEYTESAEQETYLLGRACAEAMNELKAGARGHGDGTRKG